MDAAALMPLTAAETQLNARITRSAHTIANAMHQDGERNARVLAAALLVVLENNPDLGEMFEQLCGKMLVTKALHRVRTEQ